MSFKLMVHAWDAEVPTQSHRLVLMKLVDCCDDDGRNIFPALATVATKAKCSTRHARRVISEFCRIGLLRRIREGGQGAGSTARYEMDVDLLARLARVELYPALIAAAAFEPLGEDDGDHALDACDEGDREAGSGGNKADRVSALSKGRRTPETDKADKLSPPTPYRPLKPERESADASAGDDNPEGVASDAGHASDARAPATLADFRNTYPQANADDQIKLENAWNDVPFSERWPAIDGIPGFLAVRKAANQTMRFASWTYLRGRNWRFVEAKAAEQASAQAGNATVTFAGWSRSWWLLLFDRIKAGRPPGFWMQQADAGKPFSATQAEIDTASKRIGDLGAYRCDGPEIEAWRPWLGAKGARIPVFKGDFRVFLPGALPPGRKHDDGDDEVTF